jgi:hypothetical protein
VVYSIIQNSGEESMKREPQTISSLSPFEKFRQLAQAVVNVPRKDIEDKRRELRQPRKLKNKQKSG